MDLTSLLSAYQQSQAQNNDYYYGTLGNIGNYTNQSTGGYLNNTSSLLSNMMGQLSGITNPEQSVNFNPGYTGVGDEWTSLYQSSMKDAIDQYGQASQLLYGENQDEANKYTKQYEGFISNYLGGLQNLGSTVNQGWDAYGKPQNVQASQVPALTQGYADQQNKIQQGRTNVLSNIVGVRQAANEALSRGTQLRAERQQRNLTDRSTYYANEASRNANMTQNKAEMRQGGAIQRQRQTLGRSASKRSGYLSSMLNR
jgi:hypothetical protein